MRFKIILLLFLLGFSYHSQAQYLTQTIRGAVKDEISKLPLIAVNVQLYMGDKKHSGQTDINGYFRFDSLPIGRYNLTFTSIGYEPKQINQIELTSSKELVLNIELTEKVASTGKIVIKSKKSKLQTKNNSVSVSGRTFSIE